ncbi:MAG TPA: hypothetical protein DDZ51_30165 [Planctomycetaceae bacterium]|nr:hypothetical protein [Planctomycetaceae bacterium]
MTFRFQGVVMGNIQSSAFIKSSPLIADLAVKWGACGGLPLRKMGVDRILSDSIHPHQRRRGVTIVLSLFLISALLVVSAVMLDFSRISIARDELQRSADATALAACWQLFDDKVRMRTLGETTTNAQQTSSKVAAENQIANQSPTLSGILGDLQLGSFSFGSSGFSLTNRVADLNAVRVNLRRQAAVNGEVPLFFSSFHGRERQELQSTATAALISTITGFYLPSFEQQNLQILPFALDLETWMDMTNGETSDTFQCFGTNVSLGSDGYHECNLYPQGTGSPGNRGTVDIGSSNNSTADIRRQVIHGISRQDMIDLGKPLLLDANGELLLNGDTGISAAVKDDLAAIIGQKRIIPIFVTVSGNGNTAWYKIVRFEGVRILDVKLTGAMNQKRVIIQPAPMIARCSVVNKDASQTTSTLYAPVMLVE